MSEVKLIRNYEDGKVENVPYEDDVNLQFFYDILQKMKENKVHSLILDIGDMTVIFDRKVQS